MSSGPLLLKETIQRHSNNVSSLIFLTREYLQTKQNILSDSSIVSMVEAFLTLSTHFLTKLSRLDHDY